MPNNILGIDTMTSKTQPKDIQPFIGIDACRVSSDHIVRVEHPADKSIHGRGGFVRIKQGTSVDIGVFCLYFPPSTSPRAIDHCQRLYSWAGRVLDSLPHRCTPIVLTDANARMSMHMRAQLGAVQ